MARRQHLYVIEGEVVLRMAVAANRRLHSLLISDHRLSALADVLAGVAPDVPIYVAKRPVLEAIAGFPIHRGVLALGHRETLPDAADCLHNCPPDAVVLALIGIVNHDNIGGIFRNAAAFGAAAVLLDAESCDPLYRKALRVSVGTALCVPYARLGAPDDVVALAERAGFRCLALSPRGQACLRDLAPAERTLLVLGSEGAGLPDALMAAVQTVRIPMAPGVDSLNVATASGIALHHLCTHG